MSSNIFLAKVSYSESYKKETVEAIESMITKEW